GSWVRLALVVRLVAPIRHRFPWRLTRAAGCHKAGGYNRGKPFRSSFAEVPSMKSAWFCLLGKCSLAAGLASIAIVSTSLVAQQPYENPFDDVPAKQS